MAEKHSDFKVRDVGPIGRFWVHHRIESFVVAVVVMVLLKLNVHTVCGIDILKTQWKISHFV